MKSILSLSLGCLAAATFAQQEPQFTHNMFDRLSVNPASAGFDYAFCATNISRQQWGGLIGNPQTSLFNFTAKVGDVGAAGLSFYQDRLGQESTSLIRLSWNHHLEVGNGGKLGLGIATGMARERLGADWVATQSYLLDPAINDVPVAETVFNLSLGIFYHGNNMWGGLSTTHLSQSDAASLNMQQSRHYYLMAGYDYLRGSWLISPSLLAKTDGASTQLDLSTLATYNQRFYGGLSYRIGDAIAPIVGIYHPTSNGLWNLGYSYDVTTSRLRGHSNGSHEIIISYCWNLLEKRTKYDDVRNLGRSYYPD